MDPLGLALYGGLDAVLQCQRQIIRRDQALTAGIATSTLDSLVSRGRWTRLLPRVYSVGADSSDPAVRIRAGWLWAGAAATIAGPAAAWWLGLTIDPPVTVQLTVPPSQRMSHQPGYAITRARLPDGDVVLADRVAVTSPARTCLDLARTGRPDLLDEALRLGKVNQAELDCSLHSSFGARGQSRARAARDAVRDNPWSQPERAAHKLFREAGITGWTANQPVRVKDGRRFPDIAFDDIKLMVEIDGRAHHGTQQANEADFRRQNQFVRSGWTVLRFTPAELALNPDDVVAAVRETISYLRQNHRE